MFDIHEDQISRQKVMLKDKNVIQITFFKTSNWRWGGFIFLDI